MKVPTFLDRYLKHLDLYIMVEAKGGHMKLIKQILIVIFFPIFLIVMIAFKSMPKR